MTHLIRRTLAVGAFAAVGFAGLAAPAQADTSALGCDPAVVTAAVDAARADVVAAREAYTSFVKQGTKPAKPAKGVKPGKPAKPGKGGKAEKGEKGPKASKGTKPAKPGKASRAEREALKAAWGEAKLVLAELEAHAAACAEAPVEEPPTEEPVVDPEV